MANRFKRMGIKSLLTRLPLNQQPSKVPDLNGQLMFIHFIGDCFDLLIRFVSFCFVLFCILAAAGIRNVLVRCQGYFLPSQLQQQNDLTSSMATQTKGREDLIS